jgi:hypothetical protein
MIVTKKAKSSKRASSMYHQKSDPTGIYFIQGRTSSIGSDVHRGKEKEKPNNAMHNAFFFFTSAVLFS